MRCNGNVYRVDLINGARMVYRPSVRVEAMGNGKRQIVYLLFVIGMGRVE